jgi:aspartyl-tRNA(Asn)/glutamyl-tRNA(Gln) amidotransferase subunit C
LGQKADMALKRDDVERIAHLARLAIVDEAIPEYAQNLSKILDFVAQMNAVDTGHVTPMAHPLDVPQRLRPDVVTEPDQRELFQSIGPQVEDGCYLVPKVIE